MVEAEIHKEEFNDNGRHLGKCKKFNKQRREKENKDSNELTCFLRAIIHKITLY
jgi:hypothetical protein